MAENFRYQQLTQQLQQLLAQGHWQPSERLPSVRALCSQYQLSLATVQHALHQGLEGFDIRAAEFIGAGGGLTGDALDRRLGHIIDKDGLKAGGGTDDGQDRAEACHAGEAVEEAVLVAEDDRGAQDHGRREGKSGRGGPVPGSQPVSLVSPAHVDFERPILKREAQY